MKKEVALFLLKKRMRVDSGSMVLREQKVLKVELELMESLEQMDLVDLVWSFPLMY